MLCYSGILSQPCSSTTLHQSVEEYLGLAAHAHHKAACVVRQICLAPAPPSHHSSIFCFSALQLRMNFSIAWRRLSSPSRSPILYLQTHPRPLPLSITSFVEHSGLQYKEGRNAATGSELCSTRTHDGSWHP